MKPENILKAIGEVGDDLIIAADEKPKKRRVTLAKSSILVAAAVLLVFSLSTILFMILHTGHPITPPIDDTTEITTESTPAKQGPKAICYFDPDGSNYSTTRAFDGEILVSLPSSIKTDQPFSLQLGLSILCASSYSDLYPANININSDDYDYKYVFKIASYDNAYIDGKHPITNRFYFNGECGSFSKELDESDTEFPIFFNHVYPPECNSTIEITPNADSNSRYGSISLSFSLIITKKTGGTEQDSIIQRSTSRHIYYAVSGDDIGFSFLSPEWALKSIGIEVTDIMNTFHFPSDNSSCSWGIGLYPVKEFTLFDIPQYVYDVDSEITRTYQILENDYPDDCDEYRINLISKNITASCGKTVILKEWEDKTVTVKFKANNNENGYIGIFIQPYKNGKPMDTHVKPTYVYTAVSDNKVYVSTNSSDDASRLAGKTVDSNVIITEDSQSDNIETAPDSFTVKGTVLWTDINDNTHPAQNIRVDIYDSHDPEKLLSSAETDDLGFYSVNINADMAKKYDIYVNVRIEGSGVTVVNSEGIEYVYQSPITYNVSRGQIITKSFTFSNNNDLGKSVSVQQAIALASKYVYTLENRYLDNIDVYFPDSSQLTSCYSRNYYAFFRRIYIKEEHAFDWDVLEHEYGHYVQEVFETKGITNNQIGVYPFRNLEDSYNSYRGTGKPETPLTRAWTEGWATYFAINLQKEMNAGALNIPGVGDTYLSVFNGVDLETLPDQYLLGEANEITVAGILYDLTDPVNSADYDDVCFSFAEIWELTKNNHCHSLSDIFTAIYDSPYSDEVKLSTGTTLSHFKISAKLDPIPEYLSTTSPTFSWVAQGGSQKYPNNKFRLAFYDSSKQLIYKSLYIVDSSDKTLTEAEWECLLNAPGTYFYCCVETYQSDSPETGPYYSNLIKVYKPNVLK